MECYTLFVGDHERDTHSTNNTENYNWKSSNETTSGSTTNLTVGAAVLRAAPRGIRPVAAAVHDNNEDHTDQDRRRVVQDFIHDMQAQYAAMNNITNTRVDQISRSSNSSSSSSSSKEKNREHLNTEDQYANSDPVLLLNRNNTNHTLTDERTLLLNLVEFPWCAASLSPTTTILQSTYLPPPSSSSSAAATAAVAYSPANNTSTTTNNNNHNDDTTQSSSNSRIGTTMPKNESAPWNSSYHHHHNNNNDDNNNNTDIHMNTYNNSGNSSTHTNTNGIHHNDEREDSNDEDTTTDNYYDEAEDELVF